MSSSRFWRVRGRLSGECRPKDDPLGLRTEEGRCGGLAARRGRGEGVIKFQLDGWGLQLSMGSAISISRSPTGRTGTHQDDALGSAWASTVSRCHCPSALHFPLPRYLATASDPMGERCFI